MRKEFQYFQFLKSNEKKKTLSQITEAIYNPLFVCTTVAFIFSYHSTLSILEL